jgi:magnesium chelatase subunit D
MKNNNTTENQNKEKIFKTEKSFHVKNITNTNERKIKDGFGRRSTSVSHNKTGKYFRAIIPKHNNYYDIAIDATLRAAAIFQKERKSLQNKKIVIKNQDIRVKQRIKKIGNTVLFLVDSSGSMGANQRMEIAKQAILSLLIDSYKKRDKTDLISFRGNTAETLLRPTSSVELAKKHLEIMPTGGKTPLSIGLYKSLKIFKNELKCKKKVNPFLIIISDGRANVSMNPKINPFNESKEFALKIKELGIRSVIIDCETGFIRLEKLQALASVLNAKYYHFDEIKLSEINNIVKKL